MSSGSASASLSSLTTSLEDIERRVAAMAGQYEGTDRDDLVAALYETERSLRAAVRRLADAQRLLE
jgi:hypothetical protein